MGSVFAIAIIKSGTFILQWDCISLVVGHHLPFERPLASWVKHLLLVANRVVILVLIAGTLSVLQFIYIYIYICLSIYSLMYKFINLFIKYSDLHIYYIYIYIHIFMVDL